MSNVGIDWHKTQRCRTPSAKHVLGAIANRANGTQGHSCYPTVERLAADTQLGESTVRTALRHLACDGQIRILERWKPWGGRRSSRYQLLMQGPETPLPPVKDWKRVYVYTPRAVAAAVVVVVEEATPAAAAGVDDQGREVVDGRHEPTAAAGMNLSQREVSSKQEVEPSGFDPQVVNPSPLPPVDEAAAATVAEPETGGGGDSTEDSNPAGDHRIAEIRRHRPRWKVKAIREAVDEAVADRRDRVHAELALLALAADRDGSRYGRTMSPMRLNAFNGDWWVDAKPRPPKPAGPPRCVSHPLYAPQNCPLCDLLKRANAPIDPNAERVGRPSERAHSELWTQTQSKIAASAEKWKVATKPRLSWANTFAEAA